MGDTVGEKIMLPSSPHWFTVPSMNWDFFFRRETNHRTWAEQCERPAVVVQLSFPAGTSWQVALAWALENGKVPKGSHRSGVFEIQNDEGIYSREDRKRLDYTTPERAGKTVFKTWEQLEHEEP